MRLLFVVHQFFPQWFTGTEKFVLNNAKQLIRMGHRVEVLTYGYQDENIFYKMDGILIRNYDFEDIPVTCIKHDNPNKELNFEIIDNSLHKFFYSFLKKNYFDCIHIAHPMRLGNIAICAKKLGIPIVLTLTDFWVLCPNIQGITKDGELCLSPEGGKACQKKCFSYKSLVNLTQREQNIKLFIAHCDIICSPSYFLSNIVSNYFSIPILTVYHGIDFASIPISFPLKLKNDSDFLKIGYIGTLLPHKGVHLLIESLQHISSNFKLFLFGGFFEPKYLENLIRCSQKDMRVNFMGKYCEEDIPKIMNSVDVTICPSVWWENSPITILTSLAYKKPVIGNNIGGCNEFIISNKNGFKFKFNDSIDLARVISYLCKNTSIIIEMSQKMRFPRRIEEETYEYYKIYLSLKHLRAFIND
jgi:glycosyltransferase involved in cell wall biosynthesis